MVSVSQTETEREHTEVSEGSSGVCSQWALLAFPFPLPHPTPKLERGSTGGPEPQGLLAGGRPVTEDSHLSLYNRMQLREVSRGIWEEASALHPQNLQSSSCYSEHQVWPWAPGGADRNAICTF